MLINITFAVDVLTQAKVRRTKIPGICMILNAVGKYLLSTEVVSRQRHDISKINSRKRTKNN